jgi:hypothetical protein
VEQAVNQLGRGLIIIYGHGHSDVHHINTMKKKYHTFGVLQLSNEEVYLMWEQVLKPFDMDGDEDITEYIKRHDYRWHTPSEISAAAKKLEQLHQHGRLGAAELKEAILSAIKG